MTTAPTTTSLDSRRDVLTPSTTSVNIKYHTIPASRLAALTQDGLIEAGIPRHALGVLHGLKITLTACVELDTHARHSLPPILGGTDSDFVASPDTALLVASA